MSRQDMTRRAFVAGGAVLGMALVAGCGKNDAAEQVVEDDKAADEPAVEEEATTEDEAAGDAPQSSNSILVVYYSRADENYADGGKEWLKVGHTKVMAGYIAEALGAETYEIVPVEPYPEGYDECCDVALEEQRDDARPAIKGDLPDVSSYDTVFIGCLIWWGDEPMIVRTFIEGVDLAGKTVVPFTTHGGSGLGNVPANLQAALPNSQFLDGHAVAGTAVDNAHDEVVEWAKGLLQA